MTPIDKVIHERLVKEWLPCLDEVVERRKTMRRMMSVIVVAPLVVTVFIFVYLVLNGNTWGAVWTTPLATFTAIGFVYLGKMQACDDKIVVVKLKAQLGYLEPLLECLETLSCYGHFKGMFTDIKTILSKEKEADGK